MYIIDYIRENPIVPAWVFFIAFLFVFESLRPLRKKNRSRTRRYIINILVTIFSAAAAALTVQPVSLMLGKLTEQNGFGLLNWLLEFGWFRYVLVFVALDMSFYWWHRANHKIRILWRFHNVHHLDPDLDLSTSLRFHYGETAVSTLFRVVQIGLSGVSPAEFALYQVCFLGATCFHHSNIRLPLLFEQILSWIAVTPRMHGVHHSDFMNEADSNYSVIFSMWDRIFKTLRLNVKQEDLVIGVPGYAEKEDNSLKKIAFMPFVKQKVYWKTGDIKHYRREPEPEGRLSTMAE